MNPVLTVVCKEPEGDVVRRVYPMPLTPDNLRTFWEKSRQFRTLFTEEVNGDFKKFLELFVSREGNELQARGLFWVIDDFVGVFYMTHITPVEAQVHYTFFDRRHFGREELTREMLRFGFRQYGFKRLNVEVPLYASKNTFGFVDALGFKREGRKRKAAEYKGERFDVACFGILAEELL